MTPARTPHTSGGIFRRDSIGFIMGSKITKLTDRAINKNNIRYPIENTIETKLKVFIF